MAKKHSRKIAETSSATRSHAAGGAKRGATRASASGGRPGGRGSETTSSATYVRADASGALRVVGGDVPIDSVVAAYHQGHSPEMIRAQYPSLTLEGVYGAIAYYLAHRRDVDAYLKRQDALWARERVRAQASPAPVVRRLKMKARAPVRGGGTSA